MKVIGLLNRIANGEEIPNRFEYNDLIFERNKTYGFALYEDNDGDSLVRSILGDLSNLNDEIEIIEDTPKEDKKIKRIQSNGESLYSEYIGEWLIHKERYTEYDELLMNKINEIIDRLNGE